MDKEIFNKYKNNEEPFNGETLYLKDLMKLSDLRKVLIDVIEFLKSERLITSQAYRVWDWLQHDGVLLNKEIISIDL